MDEWHDAVLVQKFAESADYTANEDAALSQGAWPNSDTSLDDVSGQHSEVTSPLSADLFAPVIHVQRAERASLD